MRYGRLSTAWLNNKSHSFFRIRDELPETLLEWGDRQEGGALPQRLHGDGELTQTKIDNWFACIGFICFQEHISSIVHPINNHLHPAVANIKTRIAKCNVFPVQDASHLTVFPQDVSRPVIAMNQTGVGRCQL